MLLAAYQTDLNRAAGSSKAQSVTAKALTFSADCQACWSGLHAKGRGFVHMRFSANGLTLRFQIAGAKANVADRAGPSQAGGEESGVRDAALVLEPFFYKVSALKPRARAEAANVRPLATFFANDAKNRKGLRAEHAKLGIR